MKDDMVYTDKLKATESAKEFKFDTNSVIFMMYLMYKCNLLTRHHLKTMFKIIKEQFPGDVVQYLVKEADKAT